MQIKNQKYLRSGTPLLPFAFCFLIFALPLGASAASEASKLYTDHCFSCHGENRLGGTGPALLPENLERLRKPDALKVIGEGRMATQMAGFGDKLSKEEIQSLVDYIYTPPAKRPVWGEAEIRASRIEHYAQDKLPNQPVFSADLQNLFIVVETGDHHVSLLDGEKLEPIHRFASRYALHGGPKYSPDGRYVYFASRDGWISKFDIYNLKTVAEVRAGINTRNLAVSSDGRFVMVGNYLPHTLVALDARDLSPIRVIPVDDGKGKSSRVSAVYDAAPRQSFIVALKDLKEVWEMSYDDTAPPVYQGLVHDHALQEGMIVPGPFAPKRTKLEDYLDDFFFDQSYEHLIGASREGNQGQVVNLDARRKVATVEIPGMPHLGSGITWEYEGRTVLATPNLKQGLVTIIDMSNWKTLKQISTNGSGFFMRSHENTPYAWVDAFNSPKRECLQVIDKQKLEVVNEVCPKAGKTSAHVEFTRDGKYALVSLWDMDGAIVVYDSTTLKEVKRIPMKRPVGKYNVYNKTTRSSGTSH